MLNEVLAYAHRTGMTIESGFTTKNVKWAISIDSFANINGIIPLEDPKVGKTFSFCPDLSQGEMIAGGITRSQFLIESLNVVALFYKAGSSDKEIKKYQEKHNFFISLLEQAGIDCPDLLLAAKVLKDPEKLQKLQQLIENQQPKPKFTDSVTFYINDAFSLELNNWQNWWRDYRQQINPPKEGKKKTALMRCFLSGELIEPVKTHPKIKGLSSIGGLATGDVLIGFNKDAFQSYGLKDSLNAAMSEASAKQYVETLNHLISEHHIRLVNTYAVYWFGHSLEEDDDDMFSLIETPTEPNAADETRPKYLLNAIKKGEQPELLNNHYYCFIVSGQSGRVMIRDFQQGQMTELLENVNAWFEDLSMVQHDGSKVAKPPKFLAIIGSLFRDLKDAPAPLISDLWRCALNQTIAIPYNTFSHALLETRKAVINGEKPSLARMGLLKAFHIRNKGDKNMSAKLNSDHPEAAYHCGRLLSVLADLQYAALGDVGAGVVQRYYTATSQTPALRIGQLMANAKNHLNKLEKNVAFSYEKRIADIMSKMETIPKILDLEHQSLFALGYYQQMAQKHADIAVHKAKKLAKELNQQGEH